MDLGLRSRVWGLPVKHINCNYFLGLTIATVRNNASGDYWGCCSGMKSKLAFSGNHTTYVLQVLEKFLDSNPAQAAGLGR